MTESDDRRARGQAQMRAVYGWDIEPTNDTARAIVDFLAAGLAETIYRK